MTGPHLTAKGFCTGLGAMALASGLGLGPVCAPARADTAAARAVAPVAEVRGRQFVDPYGCVFLCVTISGQRSWLPLLGADDKPVCGQTPSGAKIGGVVQAPASEPAATAAAATATANPVGPATAPAATTAPAPEAAVTAPAAAEAPADTGGEATAALPAKPSAPPKPPETPKPPDPSNTSAPAKPPTPATQITAAQRWIQIGAFADPANADALHRRLIAEGWSVGQAPILGGKMTVVLVGPFAKPDALRAALVRLQALGFDTAFAR